MSFVKIRNHKQKWIRLARDGSGVFFTSIPHIPANNPYLCGIHTRMTFPAGRCADTGNALLY